jgi:hypothetical protein
LFIGILRSSEVKSKSSSTLTSPGIDLFP